MFFEADAAYGKNIELDLAERKNDGTVGLGGERHEVDAVEFEDADSGQLAEDGGEHVGRDEGLGGLTFMTLLVAQEAERMDLCAETRRGDGGDEGEERLETFLENRARAQACLDLGVTNTEETKEMVATLFEPGATDEGAAPEGDRVVGEVVDDEIDELLGQPRKARRLCGRPHRVWVAHEDAPGAGRRGWTEGGESLRGLCA